MMTVNLDHELVEALERVAADRGTDLDSLLSEVIRDYLDIVAMKDLSSEDIAQTQIALLPELSGVPPYQDDSRNPDATR